MYFLLIIAVTKVDNIHYKKVHLPTHGIVQTKPCKYSKCQLSLCDWIKDGQN